MNSDDTTAKIIIEMFNSNHVSFAYWFTEYSTGSQNVVLRYALLTGGEERLGGPEVDVLGDPQGVAVWEDLVHCV